MNDRLFGSWLRETKTLQEHAYGHTLPKTEIPDIVDWVKINHIAAIAELQEALDEVSWKPWASAQFVNREAMVGELVDALHFVANLLVGVGCTDEELSAAYAEKMDRNYQRMAEGYDGITDKCAGCKRDVNDLLAHNEGHFQHAHNGTKLCSTCLDKEVEMFGSQVRREYRAIG